MEISVGRFAGKDILTRSRKFALAIIQFVRKMPNDMVSRRLGAQLFASGTSVGANLHEADMANSIKDFVCKVNISQKEAGETVYWLGLIQDSGIVVSPNISLLAKEASEIRSICRQIVNATNRKTGKS